MVNSRSVAGAQLFPLRADGATREKAQLEGGTAVFDTDFVSGRQEIRVLLADDHAVLRAGLRALLEKEPGLVVVGEAGGGSEAGAMGKTTRPPGGLVGLSLHGEGGTEGARRLVAVRMGVKGRGLSG